MTLDLYRVGPITRFVLILANCLQSHHYTTDNRIFVSIRCKMAFFLLHLIRPGVITGIRTVIGIWKAVLVAT